MQEVVFIVHLHVHTVNIIYHHIVFAVTYSLNMLTISGFHVQCVAILNHKIVISLDWSDFSDGQCSTTCGVGSFARTRQCLSTKDGSEIAPEFCGGGDEEVVEPCKLGPCPSMIFFLSFG